MSKIKFKQSKTWATASGVSLEWILAHADFAFTNKLRSGNRVRIVTTEKLNNRYNCFEIDNDRWGITCSSESEFSPTFWAPHITKRNTDIKTTKVSVRDFLAVELILYDAGEFVNPSFIKNTRRQFSKFCNFLNFKIAQ